MTFRIVLPGVMRLMSITMSADSTGVDSVLSPTKFCANITRASARIWLGEYS